MPPFNPPTHRGNAEKAGPAAASVPAKPAASNITHPPAADPTTGIIYIPSHSGCGSRVVVPGKELDCFGQTGNDGDRVGADERRLHGRIGGGGDRDVSGGREEGRRPVGGPRRRERRRRRAGGGGGRGGAAAVAAAARARAAAGDPLAGLPLFKGPVGRITAIDLNTGEHLWVMPYGDAPQEQQDAIRNHPLLKGVERRIRTWAAPASAA